MENKSLIYQFDDVQVDLRTFRVLKAGSALALEPKAFEVLVFLMDHRERVIEKGELLDAVWKESFVTPNAMTRVIAQLRKTLGDDAREAKYIETVPTRGYRFIAEVAVREGQSVKLVNDQAEARGEAEAAMDKGGFAEKSASNGRGEAVFSLPQTVAVEAAKQKAPRWLSRKTIVPAAVIVVLCVAAAIVWRARTKSASAEKTVVRRAVVSRTMQLTTSVGLDSYPAFSPDGASIAYSSDRSGSFEIYIKQFAPGSREIQITSDGEQNFQPAWSPDGKLIAYHSRHRGGIWLVAALGGLTRQLTAFGSRPAWSRDGQMIAFQSYGLPDLSQAAFGAMPPSTLWAVPANGGAPRQITQVGKPSGGHGAPAWSPDGKRIVFVTNDIGLSEVWSVSSDGNGLQRLGEEWANFYDPVYSPDGQYIYLSTASGNFRLWKVRVSPETGLPTEERLEVANTGAVLTRHMTVSPDGKRIAYSAMTMTNNIGSVRLAPHSLASSSSPILLTQDTNYRKLMHTFSPDGRQIAFNVWRQGADTEIWLMDADGGNPRQLIPEPARLLGWLPEGDRLVFASKGQVWIAELKSGKQTLLAGYKEGSEEFSGGHLMGKGVGGFGRLSPDGKRIAFNSREGGAINLWVASFGGGAPKQLTFDHEMMGFPSWSSDGRFLALEMKRGDDTHIAVIPSDGGTPTQLTFEPGQSWPGTWSPDGDKIGFVALRDGVWNVWWVSRKDKTQKQITHYTKPNAYVRYPAWSPLGHQIVYEYAETKGNIWIMELK